MGILDYLGIAKQPRPPAKRRPRNKSFLSSPDAIREHAIRLAAKKNPDKLLEVGIAALEAMKPPFDEPSLDQIEGRVVKEEMQRDPEFRQAIRAKALAKLQSEVPSPDMSNFEEIAVDPLDNLVQTLERIKEIQEIIGTEKQSTTGNGFADILRELVSKDGAIAQLGSVLLSILSAQASNGHPSAQTVTNISHPPPRPIRAIPPQPQPPAPIPTLQDNQDSNTGFAANMRLPEPGQARPIPQVTPTEPEAIEAASQMPEIDSQSPIPTFFGLTPYQLGELMTQPAEEAASEAYDIISAQLLEQNPEQQETIRATISSLLQMSAGDLVALMQGFANDPNWAMLIARINEHQEWFEAFLAGLAANWNARA